MAGLFLYIKKIVSGKEKKPVGRGQNI